MRLLTFLLLPGVAHAHPIDEVVQAAYLTLAPGEVRLELDLVTGAEVAGDVLALLDADGDGAVGEAEGVAFARGVLDASPLLLDGVEAAWVLGEVAVPEVPLLLAGGAVVRITATVPRADAAGDHVMAYETRFEPADSLWMANVFLRPGDGWAYAVEGQERGPRGQSLVVTYRATPE